MKKNNYNDYIFDNDKFLGNFEEKFNSLDEIMKYFDANYYEWGSVFDQNYNQNAFFICDYKEHC